MTTLEDQRTAVTAAAAILCVKPEPTLTDLCRVAEELDLKVSDLLVPVLDLYPLTDCTK